MRGPVHKVEKAKADQLGMQGHLTPSCFRLDALIIVAFVGDVQKPCIAVLLHIGNVELANLVQTRPCEHAYAKESEGYTRSKVCFSDNWFKMRRWEKRLAQVQADREKAREAEAKGRASLAEWIHERHPLCRHITNRQIEDLIASRLVTPEQVRAAGLQA